MNGDFVDNNRPPINPDDFGDNTNQTYHAPPKRGPHHGYNQYQMNGYSGNQGYYQGYSKSYNNHVSSN